MRKIILLFVVILLILRSTLPVRAEEESLNVFYAGPNGGIRSALVLAKFQMVEAPALADVLVLNDTIPAGAAERYKAGAGLVLVLGAQLNSEQVSGLLGSRVELTREDSPVSLVQAAGSAGMDQSLFTEILWNSAPQIRERFEVSTTQGNALVSDYDSGNMMLWQPAGADTTFVLNAFVNGANPQIQEWAYFNYMVYHLTMRAAGRAPQSFADYPAAPVPHQGDQNVLVLMMGVLISISITAFLLVRKYSSGHPELLDNLVSSKTAYAERQAHTEWEEVGFHRPLGGFLIALMMGLVFFVPLIIYQSLILPVYILPSAQALGIWGRVTQFFNLLWTFFDMGTGLAFVKFFSQHRVKDPRKAIQYGQVFVWWQVLSGSVQVALVIILSSVYLPHTAYALYAWSVIIHTFIQVPGFYAVMKNAFRGWQRSDYGTTLELGASLLFPMLTQPLIVILMTAWGRGNPTFGPGMGGLLGVGLAAYATEALTFLGGMWLYHRLGYNTRVLFLAHFDWNTIKDSFRFGVFEMIGSTAWALGQAVEILITQTRLVNYTEVWGNWVLAQNFVFGYSVVATLYDNLMPSISEACSNAYIKLSQYYSAMAYKWGGLVNGFIAAALLAVTPRFILGATGPEFARAAGYAVPLLLWGAVQYPSWVGDNVQNGANRPYLKTALIASEQFIRIFLAYLLVSRFQIYALIIAYFAGLLSKDILSFFINNRLCFKQRFYFWQSLGAPLLAGGVHYLLVTWLTGFIWKDDQVTSVLIFLIAILFSFPLYAFLYGLFGGWDDATLAELREAARLSTFMRPLSWLFWKCNALGAGISPLHGRFPISIRAEAMQEAALLTRARVKVDENETPPPLDAPAAAPMPPLAPLPGNATID